MSAPVQLNGQAGVVVRSHAVRKVLTNPLGLLAVVVLAAVSAVALFAPMLAPIDPNYANIGKSLGAPDAANLLGTDGVGRDIWSRMVYGARTTLLSAVLCAGVAVGIGLPTGLIAGYYGGRFDGVASWFVNVTLSLPGIIVLLAVRAAFGPSVWISMIAFGILISPSYFRLTRTAVQSVRNELYVDAARVSGLSDRSIIARHIFAVVRAPIIIQTAMVCGFAIAIQSGLEFLGLGDASTVSWGNNLFWAGNEGALLTGSWWVFVPSGVCIALVAFALALINYAVDEVTNPRLRKIKTPKDTERSASK